MLPTPRQLPTTSASPLWRVLGVAFLLALVLPRVVSGADHDHLFSASTAEACAACVLSATPAEAATSAVVLPEATWTETVEAVRAPEVPSVARVTSWIDACGPPAARPSQSA